MKQATRYLLLATRYSLFAVLTVAATVTLEAADTLYVAAIAEPGGDGQSWQAPYRSFQDASERAVDGDEIWVARGMYSVLGSQMQVANGVKVYGGFQGNESLRELRDWYRQPSTIELEQRMELSQRDSTTRYDGLIFMGPNSGVRIDGGAPRFINCRFTGIVGTAMELENTGRVRIEYCVFDHNTGDEYGALTISGSDGAEYPFGPFIGQTLFWANSTSGRGGGVSILEGPSEVQFSSCVFDSNHAGLGGGGVFALSKVYITNTTFIRNSTDEVDQQGLSIVASMAFLQNSIFWNGDIEFGDDDKHIVLNKLSDGDTITSIACMVERDFDYGFWQSDPQLVDIDDVLGMDGFFGTDDDGFRVTSGSLQKDGGVIDLFVNKQNTDAIGNPRLVGRKIDVGAYETQRSGRNNPFEVVEELRKGELVVFFRHAKTDWTQQDPGPSPECFPGRNLGPEGREQSSEIGKHMIAQDIPTGDANSSPVCRCWETLDLMLGRSTKLQHWAGGTGEDDMAARLEELQTAPTNGCRVISTHDRVANMVFNADGGGSIMTTAELMEGDALIVRPLGDTMLVIAHWCSDTWERYHVRFPLEVVSVNAQGSMVGGSLLVWPNPAEGAVTISVEGRLLVSIVDGLGRTVWTGVVDSSRTVNMSSVARGYYRVVVSDGSTSALIIR